MLSFDYAQFQAIFLAYALPCARILAFVAVAPIWGTAGAPMLIRLMLGLALSFVIAPVLPEIQHHIALNTWATLDILAAQIFIGIAMGLSMRLVFSAINIAGEYIGYQMGLGFATFYDPVESSQTPVMAEFMSLIAILLFLSINGHYLYIEALVKSFHYMPVDFLNSIAAKSLAHLANLGALMFSFGLLLALPIVATILMINTTLAILTRAAPQLNIFALGFPMTLLGGFVLLGIGLSYMQPIIIYIFERALESILAFFPR